MVFNRGCEKLFPNFKKSPGNTFPSDGLAGETATQDKWLIEVLTLNDVKINPVKTIFSCSVN